MFKKHNCIIVSLVILTGCATGLYPTGEYNKPLKLEETLTSDKAGVILSTRTQIQTTNNLYFYFIKGGAKPGDKSQMIQVMRPAGVPIVGTYSTTREYQLLKAQPGKYFLYGHSVGFFPDNTPGASRSGPFSAHWRGIYYSNGDLVSFDVRPGEITYIGDVWLQAPKRTKDEIKPEFKEVVNLQVRLSSPRIEEAKDYLAEFTNSTLPLVHNTSTHKAFQALPMCETTQKEINTPWVCPEPKG